MVGGRFSLVDLGGRGRWEGEEDLNLTADARLGLHRPCSAPRFPCCFGLYDLRRRGSKGKASVPHKEKAGRPVVGWAWFCWAGPLVILPVESNFLRNGPKFVE
jgi:hypothetical protein